MLDVGDSSVGDGDHPGTTGAGFAAIQARQTAQISVRRCGGQRIRLVYVAEQPAVEPGALELQPRGRRIG